MEKSDLNLFQYGRIREKTSTPFLPLDFDGWFLFFSLNTLASDRMPLATFSS